MQRKVNTNTSKAPASARRSGSAPKHGKQVQQHPNAYYSSDARVKVNQANANPNKTVNMPPQQTRQQPRQMRQQPQAQQARRSGYYAANQGGVAAAQYHGKKRGAAKIVVGVIFGLLVLLAIAYAGVAVYFSSHFMPQTKIGSTDISLLSTTDAENSLNSKVNSYKLSISGNGFDLTLTAQEIGLSYNATSIIQTAHSKVNNWAWPIEILKSHDATDAMVNTSNNSGMSDTITTKVNEFNATAVQPINASISYDSKTKSFAVSKEQVGTALDASKIIAAADEAVAEFKTKVSVGSEQLLQPTLLSSDPRFATAQEAANKMLKCDLKLTMKGNTAGEVNADTISNWVSINENFNAILNNEAMETWINELATKCNTVGTSRTYTRGSKTITVSGGVYGWEVDYESLASTVTNAVTNGTTSTVEVPVQTEGAVYNGVGQRDWGNRYIDIDLAEQHVYMYDDSGSLIWESDCISGIPDGTHDTSTGVYWINQKKSPSKLEGYENGQKIYTSTVQYWMPFDGNAIGLHDADWQPSFGGTMYADGYGSHGCVNLPPAKAQTLYDLVQEGDCVVSHW